MELVQNNLKTYSLACWLVVILNPTFTGPVYASNQNLPSLGDPMSALVSSAQERKLGQGFLRALRNQAPILDDPIIQDYLEHLTYKLVSNSQLDDRRLDLIIIDSPTLNAFAVPGGIIGIHDGLFKYAETEQELAAILAHEIAHLSQRHYARGVEAQQKSSMLTMAGVLTSIIVMTTVGGEAGTALLSTVQGVSASDQLRHSRAREAEADRIGINTLIAAKMNPRAMAYMFEQLEKTTRYKSNSMPEFLRTHPVTQSRITDAYNQTAKYPHKDYPLNIDFQIMKARAKAINARSPGEVIPYFLAGIKNSDLVRQHANIYGLILALTEEGKFQEAKVKLAELLEIYPNKISIRIAEANFYMRLQQFKRAEALLNDALANNPGNYPLTMMLAEVLLKTSPKHSQDLLTKLATERQNDAFVWYHLAEAAGLAKDIPTVHWSRAEYFVLTGNLDRAIQQLSYVAPLVPNNFQQESKIRTRIKEIEAIKKEER